MATRTERVVLELDGSSFTSGMARAAASAALLRRELDGLSGTSLQGASQGTQSMSRDIDNVGRSADRAGPAIDRLSGRLGLIVQAATVLTPAATGIGAVAIPAITGLANSLAAAGLGAGSLIIAMQGVSDAVKAVDAYQLDPTVANLEKAREAMQNLGPDAREFVMAFQDFQPVLTGIRDAAAEGWFPGLTESLENLERIAPRIEQMVRGLGEAGGELLADATASLGTERWTEFLDFLSTEMPTTLTTVGIAVGDLAHGMAELWMAFDPLNDDFSSWMLNTADGFDQWAQGLAETQGFQDFIEYVQDTGPQVQDTLAAFATAAVDFVKATAPLGGPVLSALEMVAKAISTIADSSIGSKLFTMAAAFVVLNKSLAVTAALMRTLGFAGAAGALRGGAGAAPAASRGPMGGIIGGLTAVTSASDRARTATGRLTAAQQQQRAAMGQVGKGLAVGAAGAVAFAVASGKLGDGMGLSNTAMLGLVGSLTGPWGAAVGAGVGFAIDLASANDDAAASIEAVQTAIDNNDFAGMNAGLIAARSEVEKLVSEYGTLTSLSNPTKNPLGTFKAGIGAVQGIFGDSPGEAAAKEYERVEARAKSASEAAANLGRAMGMTIGPLDGSARSTRELYAALEMARPAMDALSISQEDLQNAQRQQDLIDAGGKWGELAAAMAGTVTPADDLADRIRTQAELMDSAAGRNANYSTSLRLLATDAGTAAEQADRFREAMGALVGPALDAEAALSAQRDALKAISELNADAGFTQKTEVGRQNLAVTREYTAAVQERLATMINANRSEEDIARALKTSRAQFIESGVAAGFSAKQMRNRANAIGLTPKLVETTFRELGITKAERAAASLRRKYDDLPKDVRTHIRNEGIPKTLAEARQVADQLDLTAKERRALMRLVVEGMANTQAAKSLMESFRDKTVTMRINTIRTESLNRVGQFGGRADGGSIPKDGGDYRDKYLYMLAPGEEVISNRYGQADQFRADRAAGRIPGYATGGTVGFSPANLNGGRATTAFGAVATDANGLLAASNEWAAALQRLRKLSDRELKERERELARRIRAVEKSQRLTEKQSDLAERRLNREKALLEQEKAILDEIVGARKAFADQVSANFRTDIFGGDLNLEQAAKDGLLDKGFMEKVLAFTQTEAGFEGDRLSDNIGRYLDTLTTAELQALQVQAQSGTLQQDAQNATQFERLLEQLTGLGLDGGAYAELAASGNIAQAQAYANMTPEQIATLENLYNVRNSALQGVGAEAGDAQFGAALQAQTREVRLQTLEVQQQRVETVALRAEVREGNQHLRRMEQRMAQLERAASINGPDRIVKGVDKAINGAVAAGQRAAT